VGDSVSVDEVLCEIETDKTSVPVSCLDVFRNHTCGRYGTYQATVRRYWYSLYASLFSPLFFFTVPAIKQCRTYLFGF